MGQSEPAVSITRLRKTYDTPRGSVTALGGIDLSLATGELVALLGPSGCGKTTCLRSIAGLEQPDGGEIRIGETTAFSAERQINVPPERRRLGMVFQSYALWPHMTVGENLAYPLGNLKLGRSEVEDRVRRALITVSCELYIERLPGQLSGGQQQRVALARALAYEPRLILFDEPLSNLDAKLRERMRTELAVLHRRLGFSALYVTHDQTEAMTLASRIVMMDGGRILQIDTPQGIYERPASAFVANFMGAVNFLVGNRIDATTVETRFGRLAIAAPIGGSGSGPTLLGVRPHHVTAEAAGQGSGLPATVEAVSYLGASTNYLLRLDEDCAWTVTASRSNSWNPGERLMLRVDNSSWMEFPGESVELED